MSRASAFVREIRRACRCTGRPSIAREQASRVHRGHAASRPAPSRTRSKRHDRDSARSHCRRDRRRKMLGVHYATNVHAGSPALHCDLQRLRVTAFERRRWRLDHDGQEPPAHARRLTRPARQFGAPPNQRLRSNVVTSRDLVDVPAACHFRHSFRPPLGSVSHRRTQPPTAPSCTASMPVRLRVDGLGVRKRSGKIRREDGECGTELRGECLHREKASTRSGDALCVQVRAPATRVRGGGALSRRACARR